MTAVHIVSRAEVLIRHHGYTPSFDLGLKGPSASSMVTSFG